MLLPELELRRGLGCLDRQAPEGGVRLQGLVFLRCFPADPVTARGGQFPRFAPTMAPE